MIIGNPSRSPEPRWRSSLTTSRWTFGHAEPARTAAGSIPAAARPACRHLASFAKGTEVVISAPCDSRKVPGPIPAATLSAPFCAKPMHPE